MSEWARINFSPLGELGSIYTATRDRAAMQDALANVDFDNPDSMLKAASALARSGNPVALERANMLAESARKKQEMIEGQQLGAAAQGIIARQGGLGGAPAAPGAPATGGAPAGPPSGRVTPSAAGVNLPADVAPLIAAAEDKYPELQKVPGLWAKQTHHESRGKPLAISPQGAMGVGQVMPATAKALGIQNPFDPAENIDKTAGHMNDLLRKYNGNVGLALAAYHAGEPNVNDFLAGRPSGVGPKTQAYVKAISGKSLGQWQRQAADPQENFKAWVSDLAAEDKARFAGTGREAAEAAIIAGHPRASKNTQDVMQKFQEHHLKIKGEHEKEEYADFRKDRDEIHKFSRAADTQKRIYTMMEQVMNDPAFISGTGTEFSSRTVSLLGALQAYAHKLEVTDWGSNVLRKLQETGNRQEVFRALSNKLTLAMAGGSLGHQISNPDRDFLQAMAPQLGYSPAANRALIEAGRAIADREQRVSAAIAQYEREGGKSKARIQQIVQRIYDETPILIAGKNAKGEIIHTKLGRELATYVARSPGAPALSQDDPESRRPQPGQGAQGLWGNIQRMFSGEGAIGSEPTSSGGTF